MTPTFAAGLGVVIAAGLAAPMTKNVLNYNAAPDRGQPCPRTGCRDIPRNPGGALASARPGVRLASPAPQQVAGPHLASLVRARYRTIRDSPDGDWSGHITLTGPGGRLPARWTLRLRYPSDVITGVWRNGWLPHGRHAVTVSADQNPGAGASQRQQADIVVMAEGRPGPPAHCTVNGLPCRLTRGA